MRSFSAFLRSTMRVRKACTPLVFGGTASTSKLRLRLGWVDPGGRVRVARTSAHLSSRSLLLAASFSRSTCTLGDGGEAQTEEGEDSREGELGGEG